jgi:hypothetical protein
MAEAVQNNSNRTSRLLAEPVELIKAVVELIPEIPDQEAWQQRRRLFRALPEALFGQLLFDDRPPPQGEEPTQGEELSAGQGLMFWLKKELAIELLDLALCDGELRLCVWPPPDRAITGAHEERLLPLQWRVCGLEHRRQMIRANAILASADDKLLPYDRWRIVLEAEAYAAWRQQLVRKWTPISVSEAPATADHAVAEPVSRERAEPFDKGMPDREQRPNSVNTLASAAHPGDSPAEASIEVGTLRGRRGPKEKYDWLVSQAEFFSRLNDAGIGPHDQINISQYASDLMTWGELHLGEDKTPEDTVMRANVTKCWDAWKRRPSRAPGAPASSTSPRASGHDSGRTVRRRS